jgi:hypothetical protein
MTEGKFQKRIVHEANEFMVVFLFLAPFFISFAIYRVHLLGVCGKESSSSGTAVLLAMVNALVLAKVILTGEIIKISKPVEGSPLIFTTLYKAAAFTILYAIFAVAENTVRASYRGLSFSAALRLIADTKDDQLTLSLVVFFAFIPFFVLREIRRVLGEGQFRSLFFATDVETS